MAVLQVHNKGLYTNPNELSSVPPGALLTADNCVITADNVIEPRRGQDRIASLTNASDRSNAFEWFQSQMMINWTGGNVGYLSGSSVVALSGTYNHIDASLARTRFLLSQSNLYFTSSGGVFHLDTYNGTPVQTGVPKALDLQLSLTGATGFLDGGNQTAYRMLWGYTDANGTLYLGAPSGRAVITNSNGGGTTRDVSVTFTIPSGITTSYFYQIYRSQASGGVTITPNDELGLVYENNPSSGDISTGTITFTDATPDSLIGATIYTAASQEGIAQSNERPPLAWDIEEFATCMFYANVTSKQRLTFTILGVGGTALQNGDVLTIAGTTFTGSTGAENIATRTFLISTGGTAAQNIQDTANSLVRCINRYASGIVYALYLSGPTDLPGQILLEERSIGGATFAVTVSAHGTSYNPVLPTSGTSVSSSSDAFGNGLMFSKPGINEAVPLSNIRRIGSANNRILRIKKLRNTLFILKEREGIYRLTGTDPSNFQIDLFDSSARLIAPDTLKLANNQLWCLTDQGETIITETGVSVVSRPIENLILDTFGSALTQVQNYSFGIGYETDRQYHLCTVQTSSDTTATQDFVFNIFTQSFTRWPNAYTAGAVSPIDGKLYLGDGLSNYILRERKSRDYTDYVDYGSTFTITSSSGTSVYLNSTAQISVGDLLYSSSSLLSVITGVFPAYVTVNDTLTWSNGSVTVYKSYECVAEYAAITGQNPGTLKQWPECDVLFKAASFNNGVISFETDISQYYDNVSLSGIRTGLWGLFEWGNIPWGGVVSTVPIRVLVPLEKQYGSYIRVKFTLREGYGYFKLNGFSIPMIDTESPFIGP